MTGIFMMNCVVKILGGWSIAFFNITRGQVELILKKSEYSGDRFMEEYEVIPKSGEVDVKEESMILRGDLIIRHETRMHLYRNGRWYQTIKKYVKLMKGSAK
jgi:hypothetical protein